MITIIIGRLKDWYELQLLDQQQGFRSARGTTDGIFIAKSIQQITDIMKKPTPVLFVDLTAAFDHVERNWLFMTIEKRFANNSSNELVDLLKAIYSYTTTALAENLDDKFELKVGITQKSYRPCNKKSRTVLTTLYRQNHHIRSFCAVGCLEQFS